MFPVSLKSVANARVHGDHFQYEICESGLGIIEKGSTDPSKGLMSAFLCLFKRIVSNRFAVD
jgi:hypothetical protein